MQRFQFVLIQFMFYYFRRIPIIIAALYYEAIKTRRMAIHSNLNAQTKRRIKTNKNEKANNHRQQLLMARHNGRATFKYLLLHVYAFHLLFIFISILFYICEQRFTWIFIVLPRQTRIKRDHGLL